MNLETRMLTRRKFLQTLGGMGIGVALAGLVDAPWMSRALAADHVTDTFAAFVDLVFPKTPLLPHATGGVELGVHQFVMTSFDSYLAAVPSLPQGARLRDVVAATIDGHATQVTPGKTFVDQSPEERLQTLRAMDESPAGDVRFVAFAIFVMAALGFYSEWPGYGSRWGGDHEELDMAKLPVWGEIGFPGPADGYPKLLYPYNPGAPLDPETF